MTKLLAETLTKNAGEALALLDDDKGRTGIPVTQQHVVDSYFLGVEAALALVQGRSTSKDLLGLLKKARKSLEG